MNTLTISLIIFSSVITNVGYATNPSDEDLNQMRTAQLLKDLGADQSYDPIEQSSTFSTNRFEKAKQHTKTHELATDSQKCSILKEIQK